MMRVIFSIYCAVTCIITGAQFLTEYLKTQDSISSELRQVEATVRESISISLWQFDQSQVEVLVDGLLKMPIIEGVDVIDQNGILISSKRSFLPDAAPLSTFETNSDLTWTLNNKQIPLGTLVLYSSSEVVFDRVLFGFFLIASTALIKLSILFWLFVWAFNRYLASPLKDLMTQVDKVELSKTSGERIQLSEIDNNELVLLQTHINKMLVAIEVDRDRLIESEQAKRNWLEGEVQKRTEDLLVLNDKLKDLAKRDSLTGILNRGSFFETAQQLLMLAHRQRSPAAFIFMDLDHFKLINDNFGHFAGDKVLIHFTQTIKSFLRKSDLIGRLGGEEFAIFISDTGLDGATQLAEKIRMEIANTTLTVDNSQISYTVSVGVEAVREEDNTVDDIFKRVDLKLYSAKGKGRDRVES